MKRRVFLRNAALTSMALPLHLNGFGMFVHGSESPLLDQLANIPAATEDRILVVINLVGGNDGLNMVIPLSSYSNYYSLRSNIAIPETSVLPLTGNSDVGLHPALTGLRDLYNDGMMAIIHSSGYPNQNLSHARSSDIWMTATSSSVYESSGWLGRYLEQRYPGFPDAYPNASMEDPLALQIGSTTTPTLHGTVQPTNITINNADDFYKLIGENSNVAGEELPCCEAGELISYIRYQQVLSVGYSVEIKAAADAGKNLATYPSSNKLADQLKIVARLIDGGLKTKIYFVSHEGFDTHSTQVDAANTSVGTHANLLANLGNAIKAFYNDLKLLGKDNRVMSLTFSEFGRRATSNASFGTDHGHAAPQFIIGPGLHKQQIGTSIDFNTDLIAVNAQRDIAMQIDFRRVYSDILGDWLGANEQATSGILYQSFTTTSLLKPTIETIASGKFTDRKTWSSGRMPLPTEHAVVKAGHVVQIEAPVFIKKLEVFGELQVKPGVQVHVTS